MNAADMQFQTNGKGMSRLEKAANLVQKAKITQGYSKVAQRMTLIGLFGINSKSTVSLDVELSRQVRIDKELAKIEERIKTFRLQHKDHMTNEEKLEIRA